VLLPARAEGRALDHAPSGHYHAMSCDLDGENRFDLKPSQEMHLALVMTLAW